MGIEEHCDGALCCNTVSSTIHGIDLSTAGTTVDGDIHEGVGLDRLIRAEATILNGIVIVVTVTATIHRTNGRTAGNADVCLDIGQRGLAIRGMVINRRHDTVGDLCHLASFVIAAIKGTLDLATRHAHFVATIDGGHTTATKHIAFYRAVVHVHCGQSHKLGIHQRFSSNRIRIIFRWNRPIGKAHASQIAAGKHVTFNRCSTTNKHVGLIMGGDSHAHIFFSRVIKVGALNVIDTVVAVIVTITTGKEVLVNRSTDGMNEGGTLNGLIVR